jgi:hypothetical protein
VIRTLPIEAGKVREFAQAAKSTDPAHLGPDAMVTPTYLSVARLAWEPLEESPMLDLGFDLRRILHGEEEYVFHGPPPRAGEELTFESTIEDRYEKPGRRGGAMRFATVVTTFRGPDGAVVAEQRSTIVETARPPKEA